MASLLLMNCMDGGDVLAFARTNGGGDDFRDETWVLVKWAHRPPRHSAGPGACLKAGGNTGKALIPDWQLTRKPNL